MPYKTPLHNTPTSNCEYTHLKIQQLHIIKKTEKIQNNKRITWKQRNSTHTIRRPFNNNQKLYPNARKMPQKRGKGTTVSFKSYWFSSNLSFICFFYCVEVLSWTFISFLIFFHWVSFKVACFSYLTLGNKT